MTPDDNLGPHKTVASSGSGQDQRPMKHHHPRFPTGERARQATVPVPVHVDPNHVITRPNQGPTNTASLAECSRKSTFSTRLSLQGLFPFAVTNDLFNSCRGYLESDPRVGVAHCLPDPGHVVAIAPIVSHRLPNLDPSGVRLSIC